METVKGVMTRQEKAAWLKENLDQFTGTEHHHRHVLRNVVYTDGVKAMADVAEAHWLLDLVASHQRKWASVAPFQLWLLTVNPDRTAYVTMQEDKGSPVLVRQEMHYTSFPLDEFKLYCIDSVILLPSEY